MLVGLTAMITGHELTAQHSFGVVGGFSFTNSNDSNANVRMMTRYNAGLTYQLKLPLGFSIQPSLIYHAKAATMKNVQGVEGNLTTNCGYVELPVSIQWGPDLVLFRPFLDVTPFVGYGVNASITADNGPSTKKWDETGLNRWEYGIGLGVGLEIWRFQIIGRYNWNLGNLMDLKGVPANEIAPLMKEAWQGRNYGGITLTVSFMFTSK